MSLLTSTVTTAVLQNTLRHFKHLITPLVISLLWVTPAALAQDNVWLRLNHLGMRALSEGRLQTAEQSLQEALTHARSLKSGDKEVAASLNSLGLLYHQQGKLVLAEKSLRDALALRRSIYGERHRYVGQAFNNLARTLQAKSDYAASERFYTTAIDIYQALYGSKHPLVADTMSNLGSLYQATNRYDRAQAILLESYTINKDTFGAYHPKVAKTVGNLAGIAVVKGDVATAEELYKQVISIHEKTRPVRYSSIVIAMNNLTAIYRSHCRDEEAKALATHALTLISQHLGNTHTAKGSLLLRLASSELVLNDTQSAQQHYQQAYDYEKQISGASHPRLVPILDAHAKLLRRARSDRQAQSLEDEASQIRTQHKMPAPAQITTRECDGKVIKTHAV